MNARFSKNAQAVIDTLNAQSQVNAATDAEFARIVAGATGTRVRSSHALCTHKNTKVARAKCRRERERSLPIDASTCE